MWLKDLNEEGFTLLETLVALIILGIGLSTLIEGFVITTDSIEYQRDYNYVLNWSDGKLLEVVNGLELTRHGDFEYREKIFRWDVEEEYDQADISSNNGLKTFKLTVSWSGSNGKKNYSIERILLDI